MVWVEHKQKCFIPDWLAHGVEIVQGPAVQHEPDTAYPAGVPLVHSHLSAVGPQPGDVLFGVSIHLTFGLAGGIDRAVLEKLPAMQVWVLAPEVHHLAGEVEQ